LNEILETLQSMLQKVIAIQSLDIPQIHKDNAKKIMNESLDFVNRESSPQRINQLTYEEFKKRRVLN